jgi:hypothetical protein
MTKSESAIMDAVIAQAAATASLSSALMANMGGNRDRAFDELKSVSANLKEALASLKQAISDDSTAT